MFTHPTTNHHPFPPTPTHTYIHTHIQTLPSEYVKYKKQHELAVDLQKRVAIHAAQKQRARKIRAARLLGDAKTPWLGVSFSLGKAAGVGGEGVAGDGVGPGFGLGARSQSSKSLRSQGLRSGAFTSSHERLADPAYLYWMQGKSKR